MASPTRRRRSLYRFLPQWLTAKRLALSTIGLVALVGVAYGVRVLFALAHAAHENPLSVLADVVRGKDGSDVQTQIDSLNRINIALYGYGGPGHDGPYLTDSIMVISIQPQRGRPPQVAEVSIPRDWYVPIQVDQRPQPEARINEAFQDGMQGTGVTNKGPQTAARVANATLEKVLGIHIDHYVGVDFQAFKDAVDDVGGVDINVPHSFTDDQYPRGECVPSSSADCTLTTVHFDAGMQHMDGTRALIFSRSRHSTEGGEGTDFARSRRQQLVLQALRTKVEGVGGLPHLVGLLDTFGDHVVTDLSINDAEAIYSLVKGVDTQMVEHVAIDDTNFLYDCNYPSECGAAYLFAHDRSFATISHFMRDLLPPPEALDEKAPVAVLDGSDRGQGASQRWVSLLSGMGFAARDGGTAKVATRTRVIDNSGGQDAKTAQWLASYFGVIPESGSPASPSAAADDAPAASGVTLILGQDEERLFLNDWETTMSPAAIPTLDTSTRPRATANSRRSTSSLSSSPPPGVTPMPFQPSQAANGSGLLPGLIGHGTQR